MLKSIFINLLTIYLYTY